MVQGIYFDVETRSFSLIESTEVYSLHPVTGQPCTPAEYKAALKDLNGGKKVMNIMDGKVTMNQATKNAVNAAKVKAHAADRVAMANREAFKKVSHTAQGRKIGAIANAAGRKAGMMKGAAMGAAGVAGAAALGYGVHKLIQKRKEKKAAAKAE